MDDEEEQTVSVRRPTSPDTRPITRPVEDPYPFTDEDGDWIDDNTGETRSAWSHRRTAGLRDRSRRSLGDQDERAQSEAAAAGARARAESIEYWESGEGQRDMDAGRAPRYPRDPDAAAEQAQQRHLSGSVGGTGGGSGGGGGGGDGQPDWLRDMDAATGDIPFVGNILGSAGRNAATAEERRRVENMGLWAGLMGRAPSADDLAVDYGEEGFIGGPERSELAGAGADAGSIEAQRSALQGLQDMGRGLTSADMARMQMSQAEVGRQVRSAREADAAAMQARGLGGSGAELASMIGSQQSGADALWSRDAQAQVAAQQRALQAMQAQGSLSSGMRGQSFEEDATRRGAADDFMRWQTDYARGREGRNTERRGRTAESRASSRQQAYENQERGVAGMTDQYGSDSQARSRERAEQRQGEKDTLALVGELFD
jgi:hypothetical protein